MADENKKVGIVGTTKLRVLPTVQLPHTLKKDKTYVFNPDCDVPTKLANALLNAYPKVYAIANGKANPDDYTMRPDYAQKTLSDLVLSLPDEQKLIVVDVISALKNGEPVVIGGNAKADEFLIELGESVKQAGETIKEKDEQIAQLQKHIDSLEGELKQKGETIISLKEEIEALKETKAENKPGKK